MIRSLVTFVSLAAVSSHASVCPCQPLRYTFALNFSAICDGGSLTTGGFTDTICAATGIPTSVSHVVIEELHQDNGLPPINSVNITGPFSDGDTFVFDSVLLTTPATVDSMVPSGLLVDISGTNSDGVVVKNTWVAVFSNDCSVFPVLSVGDGFGWTTLTAVTPPTEASCPAAVESSSSPSAAAVTSAPVPAPTLPTSIRVIGSDICACQPGKYSFQLDLDSGCIEEFSGLGISETKCIIANGLNNTLTGAEAQPTSVNRILISELDQDKEILRQLDLEGNFTDGNVIEFTGFVSAETNPAPKIPIGIMATLFGTNADGLAVENDWVVMFQNNCDDFPVLVTGDRIGWLSLINSEDPPSEFCPAVDAPQPTNAPVESPTSSPPSPEPTPSPTRAPVAGSTEKPSDSPVATPVSPPTESPVVSPTVESTEAPSDSPSDVPSASPVATPEVSPVVAPPLDEPSEVPSASPVEVSPPVQPTPVTPVAPPIRAGVPTDMPSDSPSDMPSDSPSDMPSDIPTSMPVECEDDYELPSGKSKSKSKKEKSKSKKDGKGGKGGKGKKCKEKSKSKKDDYEKLEEKSEKTEKTPKTKKVKAEKDDHEKMGKKGKNDDRSEKDEKKIGDMIVKGEPSSERTEKSKSKESAKKKTAKYAKSPDSDLIKTGKGLRLKGRDH